MTNKLDRNQSTRTMTMTKNEALSLKGYFLEMECACIEACNFCDSRADNAMLSNMLRMKEIEGDDGEYYLTEKGRAAYIKLIGEAPLTD